MAKKITYVDPNDPYKFEYKSATITKTVVSDTSEPQASTRYIGDDKEIKINDIDHFYGRLISRLIGVYMVLCVICVIIAVAAYFALENVLADYYFNIIITCVFGVLALIFLLLFACKRSHLFVFDIDTTEVRDNVMSVDYDNSHVCMGYRFPVKIQIISKPKKVVRYDAVGAIRTGKTSVQSDFISYLGSAVAASSSIPPMVYDYEGNPHIYYSSSSIIITPATNTVSLVESNGWV